ncbi:MAG: Com family DNA-binding transcriptional regulator [Neptuniibacter sp.]
MQEIRCTQCRKLLAKALYQQIEIKCPRCGHMNERTASPQDKEACHGKASRTLDRRQKETR